MVTTSQQEQQSNGKPKTYPIRFCCMSIVIDGTALRDVRLGGMLKQQQLHLDGTVKVKIVKVQFVLRD